MTKFIELHCEKTGQSTLFNLANIESIQPLKTLNAKVWFCDNSSLVVKQGYLDIAKKLADGGCLL